LAATIALGSCRNPIEFDRLKCVESDFGSKQQWQRQLGMA
jgi:hypothetical protein